MTVKEALGKLQSQPDSVKKIIVWGLTILIGLGLLAWWIPRTSERLKIEQGPSIGEQLELQGLQEQLQNIPAKINGGQ